MSEQRREDSSLGCINHKYGLAQSCTGEREAHCTWLQSGGTCCWSLSILLVPPHSNPRSPAPGFSASISQSQAASNRYLISHHAWLVLLFQKKKLTLILARDFSYLSHTGQTAGNILALAKEENEQGDSHLFYPPLIANADVSDLTSTEKYYSKYFMDSK